ncbi:hypothetical protein [Nitrosopumilus sp.]|uniref:ArnT family glycosyltransferase n=1 Tax=Nitrosopumilus sp. TaxID=2024843 RepID=UPI00247B4201|nr:hypothetical protein [Nitrosopumilus sp.]MCV0430397.1 glycosyltransferase family 39 protein [Nitrosopumilus sp.]
MKTNNVTNQTFFLSKVSLCKILIIGFFGFYLISNFAPYYDTADGYTLATIGIKLSQGQYAITNELLENTGKFEFKPGDWANTIDPSYAVPLGPIGFHLWASFLYSLTGNFGLFYFGPISGILLLIVSERVSTKLFGKYVGLLAILFLVTNHIFLRSAVSFQTESSATILFLLGFYFLIKFIKNLSNLSIFLTSLFLSVATFVRINNIIFFPVELIFLFSYFIFEHLRTKNNKKSLYQKSFSKSAFKKSALLLIPWIIFFSFWFGYHDFFFGDPFTTQIIIQRGEGTTDKEISSFFELESRHFENIKQYSKYLLPYQFPAMESSLFQNFDPLFGKFWLGIISILILLSGIIISLKTQDHRKEIFVICFFILSTVWFYSALTSEDRASYGVPGRYMFPAFILFYMIIGFLITKIFSIDKKRIPIFGLKIIKIFVIICLIIFFGSSIYFTPFGQAIFNGTFEIQNPFELSLNHPPDLEGLKKNNVIVALKTDRILEYDVIPFQIVPIDDKIAPPDSISLLKNILSEDYSVFIFKTPTTIHEKIVFQDLADNHEIIFSDFSKSFCILSIKNNENTITQNDQICLE